MKRLLLIVALLATPIVSTSCSTAPNSRVVQYQTLKSVGQTAEVAVELSARLLDSGKITPHQARQVLDFYNLKFQPVYRAAAAAVGSDLSRIASPDLLSLAAELTNLVNQLIKKP